MATPEPQSVDSLRRQIGAEREELASAIESLRDELGFEGKLRARLPLALTGAFGAGFVLSGGIGATFRLVFRRGRER
jgi:hypothetical protein